MKRRRWWRRLVRIALVTLASALVVVLILLGLLHSSYGKAFVRGKIAAKLGQAVDGTVELGAVDYGFLFSDLELEQVVVHDRQGRTAIAIARLRAVLDRRSLLHGTPVIEDLTVEALDATIVQTADGRTNLTGLVRPSGSAPPASLTIRAMHVSGAAQITRPDGTVISLAELVVQGSAQLRPREQRADVTLSGISANVTYAMPGAPVRKLDLAVATVELARRGGAVEATVAKLAFGAFTVERVHAALALVDGVLVGSQAISIEKAKLDHRKVATLLGQELVRDDVMLDVALQGPPAALVVRGTVATRQTTLALDGTLDLSQPALPRYDVQLVGRGASSDLFAQAPLDLPAIQSEVKLAVVGSGFVVPALDARLTLVLGPTRIGAIAVDGLVAEAHARRGGLELDRLHAAGLGFTVDASGAIAADTTLHGSVTVAGSPIEASRVLRAAGIGAWARVPPLAKVNVTVTVAGKPEGELALEVRPTQLAIAGGTVSLAGTATLEHRLVTRAATTISVHGVDLAALAGLARRPASVQGSVSGQLAIDRRGEQLSAHFDLEVALREPAVVARVHGTADRVVADLVATIVRTADRAELAKVTAHVGHDDRGLLPDRAWKVSFDAWPRALAELVALAPPELRARFTPPVGELMMHGELAGTPNHPTGTIEAVAHVDTFAGPQLARLSAVLAPSGRGTAITTRADLAPSAPLAPRGRPMVHTSEPPVRDPYAQPRARGTLAGVTVPYIVLEGGATLPALFRGRQLDVAGLRRGLAFDATLTLPEHELAQLPVPPRVARLGGTVEGSARLTGMLLAPQLHATTSWRGYPILGGLGTTELDLTATPTRLAANVTSGPLTLHATISRTGEHLAVETSLHADPAPLDAMVPSALLPDLHGVRPGTLRSDLSAKLALVLRGTQVTLEDIAIAGALSVKGGAFAVPNSVRRWHDLELELAGQPGGVRLTRLAVHEDAARALEVSGFLAIKKDHAANGALRLGLDRAQLVIAMHDWLALGFGPPLLSDAPVATVNLDARVEADLAAPVIGVDATISKLDFAQPDRLEHSHEPEQWQVTSDVIYVDAHQRAGTLPVAPVAASTRPHLVPLDVKLHLPAPVHVLKSPLDLFARGELAITVRDAGIATRGTLEVTGGKLALFNRDHRVISGSLVFDDAHPEGNFALAFAYALPPEVVRELAHADARVNIAGPPTKPVLTFGGAINSTLAEALTTYHAGHPVYLSWPGLYPSSTAEVQSGLTYYIFGFLSNALPHLLFLDRAVGWVDPNEPRGAYGRIRNLELESYARGHAARARVVGRPTEPGRSTAELQLDHLWVDDDQLIVGAGVRAGDRLGGGLGLFFEWASVH